jgi:hypothetical protein
MLTFTETLADKCRESKFKFQQGKPEEVQLPRSAVRRTERGGGCTSAGDIKLWTLDIRHSDIRLLTSDF